MCNTPNIFLQSMQNNILHWQRSVKENGTNVTASVIPVTETQTDTEKIDISKTHTETITEKIFNTDTIQIQK